VRSALKKCRKEIIVGDVAADQAFAATLLRLKRIRR
jgi:hypothetical protein